MLACRLFVCRSTLLLLAWAGTFPPASATEPTPMRKQEPRLDAFGDPLPEGALQRNPTKSPAAGLASDLRVLIREAKALIVTKSGS